MNKTNKKEIRVRSKDGKKTLVITKKEAYKPRRFNPRKTA